MVCAVALSFNFYKFYMPFQVHSNVGEKIFFDVDYAISINTLWNSELMSCSPDMNKNFDNIVYDNAISESEKTFNCTIPFLPVIRSNTIKHPPAICDDETIGDKAMDLYQQIENTHRNHPPCAGMDIQLGLPFHSKGSVPYQGFGHNNTAFILLYLKDSVKVMHTIWDYDFMRLVAEIGGYTGLLVGFPIARGVILINSIILKILVQKKKGGKIFDVKI